MNELQQILTIALIQASYDFTGWFIWLGEKISNWREYTWKEWLFRSVKFILDFPVTIYLCLSAGMELKTLIAFYLFKQCGGVDMIYLLFRILWTGEKMFNTAGWFWWTPWGAYSRITGKKEITNHEFLIQVTAGIIISLTILLI